MDKQYNVAAWAWSDGPAQAGKKERLNLDLCYYSKEDLVLDWVII